MSHAEHKSSNTELEATLEQLRKEFKFCDNQEKEMSREMNDLVENRALFYDVIAQYQNRLASLRTKKENLKEAGEKIKIQLKNKII